MPCHQILFTSEFPFFEIIVTLELIGVSFHIVDLIVFQRGIVQHNITRGPIREDFNFSVAVLNFI